MENKIINSIFKYAEKDNVNNMSVAYFDVKKNIIVKENYTNKSHRFISNNETLYEIGSLTKLFTALVYGIIHANNEIDINNSVKYYLGEKVNNVFERITIKNLLSHTSGLPRLPPSLPAKITDLNNPYASFNKNDLYKYLLSSTEISSKKQYNYSNLGYGILGELLSSIFKKPFEQVVKEKLLLPLNMYNTDIIAKLKDNKNLPRGFNELNKETSYWDNDILSGAGCFLSNTNDMTAFLMSHFNEYSNTELCLATLTNNLLSKKMSYGWHVKNSLFSKLLGYSGLYWHNGMTGGFSSYACISKIKKCGLIILTNKPISLESYFYNFSSYI